MGCLEGQGAHVELVVEQQLAVGLFVEAVLLVVPEEDRVVRAEELREEEREEVGVVVVERTSQHPPPPLWTQKWISTIRTEPRPKLILLQLVSLPIPRSFPSSDLYVFSSVSDRRLLSFLTLCQQTFGCADVNGF